MFRYTLLFKFTEIGATQIQHTTTRAAGFRQTAAAMGVAVDHLYWTLGEYDGIVTVSCPDEGRLVALVMELERKGYVRTCLLRAYTEAEFEGVLRQMPSAPVDLDL